MRGFSASVFGNTYVQEGLVLTMAMALIVITQSLLMPRVKNMSYRYADKSYTSDSLPLAVDLQGSHTSLEAWATLELFPFQGTEFAIAGDDCLAILDINGERVVDNPSCRLNAHPKVMELAPYLHAGTNDLHIVINDLRRVKIGFSFDPVSSSSLVSFLGIFIMLLPIFWLTTIVHRKIGRTMPDVGMMIYAAFLLRILYVMITPYHLRNYDVEGHIEYIHFVFQHWTVPIASRGWEFHQGPLYYFLNAPFLGIATVLGQSKTIALQWIQYGSLMISCLSVVAATWCGVALFDRMKKRRSLLLFIGLTCFIPSTMMFASRINNDVLFQLVTLCFAGSLVRWWKNGEPRWLIATAFIIGIGFLTKANAYLFAPILLISIVFRPRVDPKEKIRELVIVGGIIAAMAGWLLVLRYLHNDFQRLFLHGNGMNHFLMAETTWHSFTTFRPWSVVEAPFVYAPRDPAERGYFWMFFFRTALFSEFTYRGSVIFISGLLSLLGMGYVLLVLAGIVKQIRRNDIFLIPFFVLLIVILEGAMSYRFLHPAFPNQDFRFSILIVPVLAYFAVRATEGGGRLARVMRAWLMAFIAASIAFVIALLIQSF
ncbi:MAG: glycosyltransferase family 39 protein [Candidatus Peribacteraceae bacterium]|nr:glycosyltransferase family 39 protein [Candidatus Peribacteraceae bacterium]MBP9850286.1 glycosyltransferase family 39 protein [Candidatus Peribacteraceae bacterium]